MYIGMKSKRETRFAFFDVRKEFNDNGFSFFPGLVVCTGDKAFNNAMTIGVGSIGNFLGVNIPAIMVYVAPSDGHKKAAHIENGYHALYVGEVINAMRSTISVTINSFKA